MSTRICQGCGAELSGDVRFCPKCGRAVESQVCQNCGAPLIEGARFCRICGKEVTSAAPHIPPAKQGDIVRHQKKVKAITRWVTGVALAGVAIYLLISLSPFFGGGVTPFDTERSPSTILTDASWSLKEGTPTAVTWLDQDGQTVQSKAISGEVQIIVDPAKMSLSSVEALVSQNGGTIFARLPALGLYWAKVADGTEAAFIKAVRPSVSDVFPNMILEPKQEPKHLTVPTNYSWEASKESPLKVTTGNLVVDDFSEPMNLLGPKSKEFIGILKNADGTVATGDGRFIETTDPTKAAPHGDIVNYYRTNGYQLNGKILGSKSKSTLDVGTEATDSNEILGVAAAIQGSHDIKERATINVSLGPYEFSNKPGKEDYRSSGQAYNNSNYLSYLGSLTAVLDSGVAGTKDAIIALAAGNSGTDLSRTLVSPFYSRQVIPVGAVDANGNIADYSNYSTVPETMIYVPVTGMTDQDTPVSGTSFAAPQVQYLINQIRKEHPDLTPEQLRQVLFHKDVSPQREVNKRVLRDGKEVMITVIAKVIEKPLYIDEKTGENPTVKKAVEVANGLFPPESKSKTQKTELKDGGLTPARDLTGTWRNPLSGQGFVVSSAGVVQYHDVEWKVTQSGNTIAGPMAITWVKGYLPSTVCEVYWPIVSPYWKQAALPTSVTIPLTGTVEGTKITINWIEPGRLDAPRTRLTGSFTTDIMTLTVDWPYLPESRREATGGVPGPISPEIPEAHAKLSLSRVR